MDIGIIGCGWLGLPLAHRLLGRGFRVIGSSSRPERLPILRKYGIHPVHLSLSKDGVKGDIEAFQSIKVLILTIPPGGRKDPAAAADYPHNIKRLLDVLPDSNILYTSSTSVYGQTTGMVDATTPPAPSSASGKAIWTTEQMLMHRTPRTTILRLGGLIGPDRHPAIMLAGRQNIPNGDAPVNLIYRDDVMLAVEAIIQQKQWGYTLPLVAPNHPSKTDYYPVMARRLGLSPPQFLPGGHQAKRIDATSTLNLLGTTLLYPDPYLMPVSSV